MAAVLTGGRGGGTAAGAACKSCSFGAGGPEPSCAAPITAPAIAPSCIFNAVSFAPDREPRGRELLKGFEFGAGSERKGEHGGRGRNRFSAFFSLRSSHHHHPAPRRTTTTTATTVVSGRKDLDFSAAWVAARNRSLRGHAAPRKRASGNISSHLIRERERGVSEKRAPRGGG